MIARTWGGKVPIEQAEAFHRHLLQTGVADYRAQPGCLQVQLWRRDSDCWAYFLLSSIWLSMESIHNYAGDRPEAAVLYPGDEAYSLIPDVKVTHYEVLDTQVNTNCGASTGGKSGKEAR